MTRYLSPAMWLIGLAVATAAWAESDAEKMLADRLRQPKGVPACQGTMTGEFPAWGSAFASGDFVHKYRSTKNVEYLDAAVRFFDALIGRMHISPDGYRGWVGKHPYDQRYIADTQVGDAILVLPMLEFAELVLKGPDTELRKTFEAKAMGYVELAKRDFVGKWDRRGTWREDGPLGAYVSWDSYLTADDMTEWRKLKSSKSTLSLAFNRNLDVGTAIMRLYRVTGEPAHRERALKIFNYSKSRMSLFQDHYVWNYAEPFGPWDVDMSKTNDIRHWVNVHTYRNYAAREVAAFVEAYHSGLTFTREDIQRIINTNLKVMWNGDKAQPKWVNSNVAMRKAALGSAPEPKLPKDNPYNFTRLAGCLWGSLADFDPTIAELSGRKKQSPPSFDRKHTELPVSELAWPMNSNRYLTMACLLPMTVEKDGWTYVASKSLVPADIEIDLYSADGSKKLSSILRGKTEGGTGGHEGILIHKWQVADVLAGDYRVRWTLRNEFREYPLKVQ